MTSCVCACVCVCVCYMTSCVCVCVCVCYMISCVCLFQITTLEIGCGLHVIVHNGIQSMGDSDNSAVCKLCSDRFLDEVIRLKVNSGCGLIQNKDLGFTKESSS